MSIIVDGKSYKCVDVLEHLARPIREGYKIQWSCKNEHCQFAAHSTNDCKSLRTMVLHYKYHNSSDYRDPHGSSLTEVERSLGMPVGSLSHF
jgi:hypothetical protein